MKLNKFLALIAVFATLFASCDKMISVISGETEQALTPVLLPSTTPIAGNDDNSNNDANNEIEVPTETVTIVIEGVEFVEASHYDPIEEEPDPYWEGMAGRGKGVNVSYVYLKVYRTSGQYNPYFAHIYRNSHRYEKIGESYVRENPEYNPSMNSDHKEHLCKYYVTYNDRNYYCNMQF